MKRFSHQRCEVVTTGGRKTAVEVTRRRAERQRATVAGKYRRIS